MKHKFYIEITDTFGGEANYSWVTRHCVTAKSTRGAAVAISRRSGLSWRKVADFGDSVRYDSSSGATCMFISHYSEDEHSEYFN